MFCLICHLSEYASTIVKALLKFFSRLTEKKLETYGRFAQGLRRFSSRLMEKNLEAYGKTLTFGCSLNFKKMKYKLIQKGNPAKPADPKKWYANPVKSGTVTQKNLATQISGRSSLTAGDVANVLQNLVELLPQELIKGNSVQLGDFGTFRLSFSSEGTDTEKEFNTEKIKGIKVLFTPSSDFKRVLSEMKFEKES